MHTQIVSSRYRHQLNRLKIMTRATLVELIYEKTLSAPTTTHKDYSAVTLMSTDVDALEGVSEMFHEAWAQVLEVIVGMILLAQQIGWFCIIPLPMIYGKPKDALDFQLVLTRCRLFSYDSIRSPESSAQATYMEPSYTRPYQQNCLCGQ
jgi:hypothetical protein